MSIRRRSDSHPVGMHPGLGFAGATPGATPGNPEPPPVVTYQLPYPERANPPLNFNRGGPNARAEELRLESLDVYRTRMQAQLDVINNTVADKSPIAMFMRFYGWTPQRQLNHSDIEMRYRMAQADVQRELDTCFFMYRSKAQLDGNGDEDDPVPCRSTDRRFAGVP